MFPSVRILAVCLILSVSMLFTYPGVVNAADHLDGPAVTADPAADITDIYAWMQDSDKINLIINVFPLASASSQFSDAVEYVFHVTSLTGYGVEGERHRLRCVFSNDQKITCDLDGTELVSGVDASGSTGFTTSDGSFQVFAGPRNDPFFFDADNFNAVRRTVRDAASSLDFDEAGCPTLDSATQTLLVDALVGNGGLPETNSPAEDFFTSLNVLSLVVQADRGLFGSGPLYSVAATTHRTN